MANPIVIAVGPARLGRCLLLLDFSSCEGVAVPGTVDGELVDDVELVKMAASGEFAGMFRSLGQ